VSGAGAQALANAGRPSGLDAPQEKQVFPHQRNLALRPPLVWHTFGDRYEIRWPPLGARAAEGRV
jgi:hypothetical protein